MLIKKAHQNEMLLGEPRTCHLHENLGLETASSTFAAKYAKSIAQSQGCS